MYQSFFGLKRRPFSFTPDVESYFPTESMEKTLHLIERAAQKGEGISLVFGGAGTGKTLFMHLLLKSFAQHWSEASLVLKEPEKESVESSPEELPLEESPLEKLSLLESSPPVVLVSNSLLETPKSLFMQLGHDLNIPLTCHETIELRLMLLDAIQKRFPQGIILLFDDAQHLSSSVLEEIRLLTDSVRRTIHLFRVVFAGTIDFEEKLTLPHLDAFNQRVVSRCYLDSFTSEETVRYILHETDELRTALPDLPSLFTKEAQKQVHTLTDGIPRLVNQLCSAALQLAVKEDLPSVDVTLLRNAWCSLQHREQTEESIEETQVESAAETVISPEEIEEIVDRKRKTFQVRHFNSVEFGTLTDTDLLVEETNLADSYSTDSSSADSSGRFMTANEYKPSFPDEDDDEDWEENHTAPHVISSQVFLKIHTPDEETSAEETLIEDILEETSDEGRSAEFIRSEAVPSESVLLESVQSEDMRIVEDARTTDSFVEEVSSDEAFMDHALLDDTTADHSANGGSVTDGSVVGGSVVGDSCVDDTATEHVSEEETEEERSESVRWTRSLSFPKEKLTPCYHRQCRKFRRRYFSQKIQHRLGLFVGLLQKGKSVSTDVAGHQPLESEHTENDMDVQTLQQYHAAVLESRHPFVRKEPHYAYQTTGCQTHEPVSQPIPYPDPKTGAPITLCWLSDSSEKTDRFGVSYSEFLKKETLHVSDTADSSHSAGSNSVIPFPLKSLSWETPPAAAPETSEDSVVRTSFHASQNRSVSSLDSGLEETFDESQEVGDTVISLAELFRTRTSVLQQCEKLRESNTIDEIVQRRLDKIVSRLTKAAEKIEKAAEVSEKAGKHVSQSAEYVASEVRAAIPTCRELFRKLSDFQEMISEEVEAFRNKKSEPAMLRALPSRRQVVIERSLSTIELDLLLR